MLRLPSTTPIVTTSILVLLAAPALAQDTSSDAPQTVTVTMIGVNDIDRIEEGERGGFARLAAAIAAERERAENVVVLHAGDSISPSLLSGIDQGEHIVELLNAVGLDVFVPGNHEFDFGAEVFRERMAALETTKLAGNLTEPSGERVEGFEATTTLEFGPVTIGVMGLTSDDAYDKSSPGELQIAPLVPAAGELASELEADAVVAVVHAARSEDMELFEAGHADFIFSGDDHVLTTLYDGATALLEAREQAQFLPVVDVTFTVTEEEGEREVELDPSFRILDTAAFEPDPDVQALIDGFDAQLDEELGVAIGTTATALDSRRASVRGGETAIGNLIADAMREAAGADIAITNAGGIRGDREYAAGTELTRRDVLTELPFGNRTVSFELTGAQVRELLEHGLSAVEEGSGRFPQVSGLTVEADPSAEPGSRVTAVTVGGEPLDEAATYLVATNDFMGGGGDGYAAFAEGTPVIDAVTGDLMANDVMAHIREAAEVAPAPEGRITLN